MAVYKPSLIGPFGKRVLAVGGVANLKYKHNAIRVINSTGSAIGADKLVAVLGYNTTNRLPKIVLADADAAATHKQIYVTLAAIANGAEGYVFEGGLSQANLNTNAASAAGDPVYLDVTAGGFTVTAPTGTDATILPVGWVYVKSATVGQIHWHIGRPETFGSTSLQSQSTALVNATATLTVTAPLHAFRTITLSAAGGFVSTLPAATGTGNRYRFVVNTTLTSSTYVVKVANATDVFAGGVIINDTGDTAAATADFWPTAATSDTFTMTQSIGGGKQGDFFEVQDIATGFFQVYGALQGVTDPATPFSATV